jgi:hypothetical protein
MGVSPSEAALIITAPDTLVIGVPTTVSISSTEGPLPAGGIAWNIIPAGAGTISAEGVVQALREGALRITAQTASRRATKDVIARPPALTSLAIGPIGPVIPGDTVRPVVVATDRLGGTPTVAPVWSADTTHLAVLGPGIFRARAPGVGLLGARVGTLTARREVTVTLGAAVAVQLEGAPGVTIGAPQQWAVTTIDRRGNALAGGGPAYALSRSPDVLTIRVTKDSVHAIGIRPGTAWVLAGRGSFMDSTLVTVILPPLRKLEASTASSRVDWMSGATVAVTVEDDAGRRLPAGALVAVTPIGFEAGLWRWELTADSALQFTVALPPFTETARRDRGVTGQVVFAAGGLADTLTLTAHYRRPMTMTWALGPTFSVAAKEFVPTRTTLRDSVGVIVTRSQAAGDLELPVSSDVRILLPRVESNLYGVAPGTAEVTQHYREGTSVVLSLQTTATVIPAPTPPPPPPPPPSGDATPIGSGYIRVHPIQPLSDDIRTAITAAVMRLEAIISTTPKTPISISLPDNTCLNGFPGVSGTIEGIRIQVSVASYDGVGGVLGAAGPCGIRGDAMGRPFLGVVFLDAADVAGLLTSGRMADVLAHEFLHVLGIGTVWDLLGLATSPTPVDPYYFGIGARNAYATLGGSGNVPLEENGGQGTAGSHWRESVFRSELMTGFLNPSGLNPLSSVTIGGLADLGYTVDLGRAESYTLGQLLQTLRSGGPMEPQFRELMVRPAVVYDRSGTRRPARP